MPGPVRANRELVVYGLYVAGGATERIHTEDLALKCWELFPDSFSWTKYAQYSELVQSINPHDLQAHDPRLDELLDTHTDCPPINEVGLLVPGQVKATGPLREARTRAYHDELSEARALLTGSITIR